MIYICNVRNWQWVAGNGHYYDNRGMLNLDRLPHDTKTLVGYLYGGLVSTTNEPFVYPDLTAASNQIYAVFVEPNPEGAVDWRNVTDAYTN